MVGWPLGACSERSSPSRFETISGIVAEVHPDTGQLTIHGAGNWPEAGKERDAACLATGDTEVYINDRFTRLEALAVGDAIEVVGYRDEVAQAGRFVVCFAYVTRPEPPAPPPELRPAATQSDR